LKQQAKITSATTGKKRQKQRPKVVARQTALGKSGVERCQKTAELRTEGNDNNNK
jgi:hypothetical protein